MKAAARLIASLVVWEFVFAFPGWGRAAGNDWPQFLGTQRNGTYGGDDLADGWPSPPPQVIWRQKIGQGWSGPVVSQGKLILFHRVENEERVDCLQASDGKQVWSNHYPTSYQDDFGFDPGPRATPAIAGGAVFTYGAEGMLHCWDMASGKKIWSVNTRDQFRQEKGFFGMACSPLVEGDAVIVQIGGHGAGVVAFDRLSGKTLWHATDDEAGYASPVAATFSGKRYLLAFTRAGLEALEPASGKQFFQFPWRSPMEASVNAASPLVVEDQIFLSASYSTGAVLLRLKESGPEKIWSGDDILSNHYATSVYRDGFLYGFDGRQEMGQRLRCVEMATGKVRWSEDDFGAGTLILAADRLLILRENGQLMEAKATPSAFTSLGRVQVVGLNTRSNAALAQGLYYARGKNELVCVDLRKHH